MINITEIVKGLNTKTLVDIWNLTNPASPIKKFSDRRAAELRILKLMADYEKFWLSHNKTLSAAGIKIPVFEVPLTPEQLRARAMLAQAKGQPAPKADLPKKKQQTSPHQNLRCPSCGFYAKTTVEYMSKGRLVCPVNPKHGKLLTAEERGEHRGR